MDTAVYVNWHSPDQTARMRMLIWTFTVRIWHKGVFPCCASDNKYIITTVWRDLIMLCVLWMIPDLRITLDESSLCDLVILEHLLDSETVSDQIIVVIMFLS